MVKCELDLEVSGDILGYKLPAWQALFVHRVLPSCGGLIVYLTLICFDIALVYEHYRSGHNGTAVFCIILMVLPATISLVFTFAFPPPGLQTDDSALSFTLQKSDLRWIFMQFLNFCFFPIAAIGRYCHQIFWWIEVVWASHALDNERTKDALKTASQPSPVELYLFLQAFIHCAPNAVLNILDIMSRFANPAYDKVPVQAVSIVVSIMRMASTVNIYRRFEREKLAGRKYPWNLNKQEEIDKDNTDKQNKELINETQDIKEPVKEIISNRSSKSNKSQDKGRLCSDLIQFSPRNSKFNYEQTSDFEYSDTSSNHSLQHTLKDTGTKDLDRISPYNSDDEYVRPISIIDKVAPKRRSTIIVIEKVDVPPPPEMPAPRPGSVAVWAEKMMENAESIPTWLSAPPRRRHYQEIIQDEPDIPRRVPLSFVRGLEPQDILGSIVHYLGWYMFLISRLLSIATFINFFPYVAIIVIFSHYQVMLLILIIPPASIEKKAFYIFLAFIYLFCLMEFKFRFRHVRVWHMFWFLVCTVETIVFTGLWASINNNHHDWWKSFIVMVIFISLLLSYFCFLVYFVLLKPKDTIVYKRNKFIEK